MALSRRRGALVERLHRRRTREREGLFIVEGVRAAEEALEHGAAIRFVVRGPGLDGTEAGRALSRRLDTEGFDVSDVDEAELARAADTETPQGVVLVCEEPGWSLDDLGAIDRSRVLLLDAVQDPGNAGTLVRAAAAFGLEGVVALDGTVDPWSTKTVRAAAGGTLQTRVVRASWDDTETWLEDRGIPLMAGDAGGEDVAAVTPAPRWALAVGNEGAGPRPELRARAERLVSVPMPGGAESLNAGVAGSILMYALTRTRAPAPPES